MKNIKLFESFNSNPIDLEKLKRYALGIEICCAGEYGDVFYNESTNHIFVNLGDSNPFDTSSLEWYIKGAVSVNYDAEKLIKITIDNECAPNTKKEPGCKKYNSKINEFKDWKNW